MFLFRHEVSPTVLVPLLLLFLVPFYWYRHVLVTEQDASSLAQAKMFGEGCADPSECVRQTQICNRGGGIACLLRQTLESSFSAVSTPIFCSKIWTFQLFFFRYLMSSTRFAILCTAPNSKCSENSFNNFVILKSLMFVRFE